VFGGTAAGEPSSSNMTHLLQSAGEVGKAVESLVTIMTDDHHVQNNGQPATSLAASQQ